MTPQCLISIKGCPATLINKVVEYIWIFKAFTSRIPSCLKYLNALCTSRVIGSQPFNPAMVLLLFLPRRAGLRLLWGWPLPPVLHLLHVTSMMLSGCQTEKKKKQKKRTVWFGFGFNMLRFRSGSVPAWRNKNLSLFANRFATVHHFGTVYFIMPLGNTLNSTIDLSAWSMRKFHQEAENYKWITRTQGNFHVLIRNRGN